jgi:hypothetical protein
MSSSNFIDKTVNVRPEPELDDDFDADAALSEFLGQSKGSPAKSAGRNPDADLADAIRRGASDLGIDPLDYAAVMSYESGGTFDPWQKGPVTKWGQHRGTIQYGEPQRKQYGVYQGQSAAEQITKSNVKYLRDRGVRPGMKLPQIYAAINGGRTDRKLSTPDVGTGRTIADNLRLVERDHLPAVQKRFGKYFQPAGALLIVHDATYIHGYLARIWRHTFGRALVQMAVITLLILGLMRWSVFGPIHQMAEWMKKLRAGDTVETPPLPHSELFAPLAKEASRFARHLVQAKSAAEEEARLRQTAESLWTAERLKEHVKLKTGWKRA